MASCAVPIEERLPRSEIIESSGETPLHGEDVMEFRLIYEGSLPPEKWSYTEEYARASDKQKVRKFLHPQLRELWGKQPDLRRLAEQKYVRLKAHRAMPIGEYATSANRTSEPDWSSGYSPEGVPGAKTWLEHIADDHVACNGNRFVPLISEVSGFTCSLDILFLRRDAPGGTWNAGDIDSRIKVLFDGLKVSVRRFHLEQRWRSAEP